MKVIAYFLMMLDVFHVQDIYDEKMTKNIFGRVTIECCCGYTGEVDWITYDKFPDLSFPTCPECGDTIYLDDEDAEKSCDFKLQEKLR